MALTEAERFQVRYYLGFPDLSSLPPADSADPEDIELCKRSSELEVRMTNLSITAELKVRELLTQLDTSTTGGFQSISSRFPFKRIEDITFRDDEISLWWTLNAGTINYLATILGIRPLQPLNPGIGLAVV